MAACELSYGNRLVENSSRGLIAELIVKLAIGPHWTHCSQDWRAWDFEHDSGARLEVKQTALIQTWDSYAPPKKPRVPSFNIEPSTGHYVGSAWHKQPGRKADLYVFAFHGLTDPSVADHRDPAQWRFHVVPTSKLPETKTIRLGSNRPGSVTVSSLSECLEWLQLSDAVEEARLRLQTLICQTLK